MTKQVQRRRGTSTQHTGFTGADGEISVNTTNRSIHVHDGSTAGGFEAARADLNNVQSTANLSINNLTVTGTVDGRDVAADGTKLDGIEAGADVTDTANVTAAGAAMLTGANFTGNVLVGTTDSDLSNNSGTADGFSVLSSGIITNATQGVAYYANRIGGSDGSIIEFRKDGGPVGSIGTLSNDLYLGTGDTGLYFFDGADSIIPANPSGVSVSNGYLDLGHPSYRFKDLWLSNNAYLGNGYNLSWGGAYSGGYPTVYASTGSGGYIGFAPNGNAPATNQVRIVGDGIEFGAASSNLNDYEVGFFTPRLRGGTTEPATLIAPTNSGYYTKIGNNVFVSIYIESISTTGYSGGLYFDQLPFTSKSTTTSWGGSCGFYNSGTFSGSLTNYIPASNSTVYPYDSTSGGTWTNVTHAATGSGRYISLGFHYVTD